MNYHHDPALRALIAPHTGELADIRPTEDIFLTDLTAVVECEKGPFFVKAMRNRPGGRRDSIVRERLINAFVQPLSPALRWEAESDEWIVLGFEFVDGRWPDIRPDSPDLPVVIDLLNRIGELEVPEVARDWTEASWDRFAANEAEVKLFRGDALLHADINHTNMLVGDRGAWVVDWSWPLRGAGFIDPAMLVVQLVSAGHSPEAAEAWAGRCSAWTCADPAAIDAFAAVKVRSWREMVELRPDRAGRKALAEAAEAWARYRGVRGI